jgi:DNA polymerase III epsilon subunit-like protein
MYTRRFWVDTETTGLDPREHFAFQISYLIEESGRILLRRTLEMRPENYTMFKFDKDAENVHGYFREKIIAFAPEAEQYQAFLADLRQFAKDRLTIAGYNIDFDIRFMRELFNRNNPDGTGEKVFYSFFDYMPCDVLQLAQACRIAGKLDLPNIDLESVCRYFGISTEGAHHSMTDILNTKAVFDKLQINMSAQTL